MMSEWIFAVLLSASACSAQVLMPSTQPGCSRYAKGEQHLPNVPECKPLVCGKYQHEQHIPGHCANTCDPEGFTCTTQCLWVPAVDSCADDIHMVTEREWQELVIRMKKLESRIK